MAVDVSKFYTPEQSFDGLYALSDKMERQQEKKYQEGLRQQAKRSSTLSYLDKYLDKKDFLTGTYYDPVIVKMLQDTLDEGMKLAYSGADSGDIMMALAPQVNKLNEYSTKAKVIDKGIKDRISTIKPNSGYDASKLNEQARRLAFFNEDGTLKDISNVDPNIDYITETVKLYPDRVTTDVGLDEFVKNSPKFVNTSDVTRYTSRGGMERKKVKITAPQWLRQDTDEKGVMTGLVPNYEIATEGGQPLLHEFNVNGEKKIAPVRLFNERDFDSLLASNPGIADWVRGQVKMHLNEYGTQDGSQITMDSPQAKNVARAILYDELKRRMPGGIEDIEISKPTQVRVYSGNSSSKKEAKPFNLSNYKKEGSYYNITVPMQGYTVTAIGDKKLLAKKVLFDPERQMVKLTEYSGRDDQGNPTGESVSEITLDDFLQNIQGNNPQTDMRFLEGLKNPITGKSIQPSGKNYTYNGKPISEEGIRKKAANSNMTFDEYIKKAGIKVNDK